MLAVIDVIYSLRSRLKDDNYTNLYFSDAELIDTLNNALMALVLEFKLNKSQIVLEFLEDRTIQIDNMLGIINAYYNNTLIKCVNEPQKRLSVGVDNNSLNIAPFKPGILRLTYIKAEPIKSIEDYMNVPQLAKNVLMYDCLARLLEVPSDESNPNKIAMYKQLLKEAKNTLTLHLNNLTGQNISFSRVVRVWTLTALLETS